MNMISFLVSTVVTLSFLVNAVTATDSKSVISLTQEVQDKKVETNQIPSQVLKQASIRYSGFALEEAFITGKGDYKLVLKKNDKALNAYYKSTGEFIREEARQAKNI
ncbi:MAG: hypothetical protein DI539_16175 [Flavobacterium psychrophilum]|nr:MAG: hypothetical protein DI539_16175 [Flavobacterium psychrophilum]